MNLIVNQKIFFASFKFLALISSYLSTAFLVNLFTTDQISVYSIYVLLPSFGSVVLSAPLYSVCSREYSRYLSSKTSVASYKSFSNYFVRVFITLVGAITIFFLFITSIFFIYSEFLPGTFSWLLGAYLLSVSQILSSFTKALLNTSGQRIFAVATEASIYASICIFYFLLSSYLQIYPFLVFFIAFLLHILFFVLRFLRIEKKVRFLLMPKRIFAITYQLFMSNSASFILGRRNGYKWLSLSSLLPWLSQFFSRSLLYAALGSTNLSLYFSLYTFLYTPFVHLSSVLLEYFSPKLHFLYFGKGGMNFISEILSKISRIYVFSFLSVFLFFAAYFLLTSNYLLLFRHSLPFLVGMVIFSSGFFSLVYRMLQFVSTVCGFNSIVVLAQCFWFFIYFSPLSLSLLGILNISTISVSGFLLNANFLSSAILLILLYISSKKEPGFNSLV